MESVDELNALDVLADDSASEEIFGKAFRGGRAAAAGLMTRLQREVRWKREIERDRYVLYFNFGVDWGIMTGRECRPVASFVFRTG